MANWRNATLKWMVSNVINTIADFSIDTDDQWKKKSIHVSCPDAQVYIVLKPMICHYPCTMSWKTMLRHNKACIMTRLKSDKHCCVTTRPVSMTWMKSETMLRHDKPVSWQDWNLGNIVVSLQSLYPWHGWNLKQCYVITNLYQDTIEIWKTLLCHNKACNKTSSVMPMS